MFNETTKIQPLDMLIIGGGAMGLMLAGLYADSGLNIGIVARHRIAAPIRKDGYKLFDKSGGGDFKYINPSDKFHVFSDINKTDLYPLNDNAAIVVAVKTPDFEDVIKEYFSRIIDRHGRAADKLSKSDWSICLIQNGLHPELRFKYLSGKHGFAALSQNVNGCISLGSAQLIESSEPYIEAIFGNFYLGSWEGSTGLQNILEKDADRIQQNLNLQYQVEILDEPAYRKLRYERAIINSANSLSAMFHVRIGDLNDNLYLKHYLDKKMQEAIAVYNAVADHDSLDPIDFIHNTIALHEKILADNYTSMAQDFLLAIEQLYACLKTEVNDLDLVFARMGEQHGINVEYNRFFGVQTNYFAHRFNQIREESIDAAQEFGRKFLDWNRVAVGLDPVYDPDSSPDVLTQKTLSMSRTDRLDILREIYTTLADRYTTIRSL